MSTDLHTARAFSAAPAAAPASEAALGDLPLWNLTHLYPSQTSDVFRADLERAATDAVAFEAKWKGKLAEAAGVTGDNGLAAAIRDMDALEDLLGRIASFAGLTYYSDMTNAENGKFFGDVQAKLTDISAHLLFFSL